METSSRRPVTKWLTVALFALLIASFALWGIGDIFRGSTGRGPVVMAGDAELGPEEFARSFRREFSQLRQNFGGGLDFETARQMGLVDRITQQIATRTLFEAHAKDMRLVVSDKQLAERITRQQAFQNSQGQFVRARFEAALQRARISEAEYTDLLRTDVHRQQLLDTAATGVAVPNRLADLLFRYRNERRVAAYTVLRDADFNPGEASEADLRAYYEAHDDPFMAPAYREVTFLHIDPASLRDEVQVSEADLREAYANRQHEFQKPERRSLRQIVFNSREKAAEARETLRTGGDFAAVAEEMTGAAPVDLGSNTRDDLLPALAEPAFAAEDGGLAGPVETALGWHLIQVTGIESGESKSFEALRDTLKEDLVRERAVDTAVSLANNLDEVLASGARLEEAADTLGLATRHVPAIDQNGRNTAGEQIEKLPAGDGFVETVFDTEQGQQSLLEDTPNGGYFVLRVDSVTPTAKRGFEAVRETVRSEWRAAQRRDKARKAAETIRQAVADGSDFTQAAKLIGVEVQTTPALRRSGNQEAPAAARALAGPLFNTPKGGVATTEIGEGMVIGEVTEIRAPAAENAGSQVAQVAQQTRQALQNDMIQQFVNGLRQRYDLRINQSQRDRILNQMY
jgi:peptidyl-prolyl cis-trans isomerase D